MHALPGLILWSSLWMAKIPAQQRLAIGMTPPYMYQLSESFFQLIGMDVLLNKSRQFPTAWLCHDDFVTLSYAFSICPIPWNNIQANYILQHQWRWGRYTNTSWAYSLKFLTLDRDFIDLYNGQVKPHLKVLRQCPWYDLKWIPMIHKLEWHTQKFPFHISVILNLWIRLRNIQFKRIRFQSFVWQPSWIDLSLEVKENSTLQFVCYPNLDEWEKRSK